MKIMLNEQAYAVSAVRGAGRLTLYFADRQVTAAQLLAAFAPGAQATVTLLDDDLETLATYANCNVLAVTKYDQAAIELQTDPVLAEDVASLRRQVAELTARADAAEQRADEAETALMELADMIGGAA